jgi:arginine/ornithine N-succinyltransferase beta subunit
MFFIRQAQPDDAPRLLKLAKLVHSNNLPPDADAIRERVARSRESFRKRVKDKSERLLVFVLEDSESNSVVGSSIISPLGARPPSRTSICRRASASFSARTCKPARCT